MSSWAEIVFFALLGGIVGTLYHIAGILQTILKVKKNSYEISVDIRKELELLNRRMDK